MPFSAQIKYAWDMKPIPDSWKMYAPLLMILFLLLTLLGDHLQPPPDSSVRNPVPESDPASSHSHDETSHLPPVSPEKAFSQAPDPGAVPPDPEREHRMAIFHYNEGNRFLSRGEWQEAVRNYKMALHHDQAFKEVHVNLSTAYLKGQQYEDARKTLEALNQLDPGHPHLHYNLACYHSLTGNPEASLESLQQAMQRGYPRPGDVDNDPDLEHLRRTAEFRQWRKTLNDKS